MAASSESVEALWSPTVEKTFQEALSIYPPCGRRKFSLLDEDKMFGRNELISRYIKLRTGEIRTRKQVSSHLQVLARKKEREVKAEMQRKGELDARFRQKWQNILQTTRPLTDPQILATTGGIGMHSSRSNSEAKAPAVTATGDDIVVGGSAGVSTLAHSGGATRTLTVSQVISQSITTTATLQVVTAPPKKPFYQVPQMGKPGTGRGVDKVNSAVAVNSSAAGSAIALAPLPTTPTTPLCSIWNGRAIATSKLCLTEFSAFMEQQMGPETFKKHFFIHIGPPALSDPLLESVDIRQIYDKFPEKENGLKELFLRGPRNGFFLVKFWADLSSSYNYSSNSAGGHVAQDYDFLGTFYGFTSQFESNENMAIRCSTKVCSFGKEVTEKVENGYSRVENGRFVYKMERSPLCDYLVNFIGKLKRLPEKYMMNSVLENFSVLQVVTNRATEETLLCVAFVFEVSHSVQDGAQYHIYKLVKD